MYLYCPAGIIYLLTAVIDISQHLLQLFAMCPLSLDKNNRRRKPPPSVQKVRHHTDQYHRGPDGRRPVRINKRSGVRVWQAAEHDDE